MKMEFSDDEELLLKRVFLRKRLSNSAYYFAAALGFVTLSLIAPAVVHYWIPITPKSSLYGALHVATGCLIMIIAMRRDEVAMDELFRRCTKENKSVTDAVDEIRNRPKRGLFN